MLDSSGNPVEKTFSEMIDSTAEQSIEEALGELVREHLASLPDSQESHIQDQCTSGSAIDVSSDVAGSASNTYYLHSEHDHKPRQTPQGCSMNAQVQKHGSSCGEDHSPTLPEAVIEPANNTSSSSSTSVNRSFEDYNPKINSQMKDRPVCNANNFQDSCQHESLPTDVDGASLSDLSQPQPFLSQGAESTEDTLLDKVGDEYLALRQARLNRLEQRFKYPKRMLQKLMKMSQCQPKSHESINWLRSLSARLGRMTFSTAFSGIDTPNIALLMICSAGGILGDGDVPFEPPKNVWACECLQASRRELMNGVNPPQHIFGNVQDFWQHVLRTKINGILEAHLIEKVLWPLILSGEATQSKAWCHTCQKTHDAVETDAHIAGTTCTAHSKKGNQNGLEDITVCDLMAWLAERRRIQEKLIIQENVEDFPSQKFIEWLGDLYDVQVTILDPADLGWGIRRRRKYHILRHKIKLGLMSCPLHIFCSMFITIEEKFLLADIGLPLWDMYFVATPEELQDELDWASSRDSVVTGTHLSWKDMTPGGSFEVALNKTENINLQKYREAFPNQVYQLNQNFDVQATRSSDQFLPTVIKNAGILWSLGLFQFSNYFLCNVFFFASYD